jgi:predicted nuclease of predicted toxin-antitoxin system
VSLFDRPLLADENIHPGVIQALANRAVKVVSVTEIGLGGASDVSILRRAMADGRIVLTHDRDFGTLAIRGGEPFVGIVYLRPGHVSPAHVLAMLDAIHGSKVELVPPFVVVARRRGDIVRIRVRRSHW